MITLHTDLSPHPSNATLGLRELANAIVYALDRDHEHKLAPFDSDIRRLAASCETWVSNSKWRTP